MKRLSCVLVLICASLILSSYNSSTYAAPLSDEEAIHAVIVGSTPIRMVRFNDEQIVPWAFTLPIGKIGIKTAKDSYYHEKKGIVHIGNKGELRLYTVAIKKDLEFWKKLGFIQISEEYFNSARKSATHMEIMNDGHKYIVSLTQNEMSYDGNDPAVKKLSEDEKANKMAISYDKMWGTIRLAKISNYKIIKNIEIKGHGNYGTKDIRLVMGIHDYDLTEIGKNYFENIGRVMDKEYKFRAILEYDPFKKKYQMIAFDSGNINLGQWISNNVVE